MKKLGKLRLKGISEILSEKELKNVMGGGYPYDGYTALLLYKPSRRLELLAK